MNKVHLFLQPVIRQHDQKQIHSFRYKDITFI